MTRENNRNFDKWEHKKDKIFSKTLGIKVSSKFKIKFTIKIDL